ncbi:hypothetical protein AKJ16_DCAP11789 [Drosera capensis]
MASTTLMIIPLLVVVLLAAGSSVSARPGLPFHPCNTLLISTYSLSFQPLDTNNNPNPNPDNHNPQFFALVARLRFLHPKPHPFFIIDNNEAAEDNVALPNPSFLLKEDRPIRPIPHPHRPALGGSFLDRGLDVLNVLASLLFGAACGALTAGTMYFVWSLFNDRSGRDGVDDAYRNLDGSSDDDDDIFNPKKPVNVYVATVPVAAAPVAVEAAKADVPAKESVHAGDVSMNGIGHQLWSFVMQLVQVISVKSDLLDSGCVELLVAIDSLNRLSVVLCECSDDGVPHIEGAAWRADEEFVGVSDGDRRGEGGDEFGGEERVGEGGGDGEVGLDLLEVGDAQTLAAAIQEGQSSLACFQVDLYNPNRPCRNNESLPIGDGKPLPHRELELLCLMVIQIDWPRLSIVSLSFWRASIESFWRMRLLLG